MTELEKYKTILKEYFLTIEYKKKDEILYFLNEQFYFCNFKKELLSFIETELVNELVFTISKFKNQYEKTNSKYYYRIYTLDYKNKIETLKDWIENNTDLDIFRDIKKHSIISKKNKKKTSYIWQNNPDKELPELYSLMIDKYKLIASETNYEQFKAVFTGQPTNIINPIKWIASNRLLAYFLDSVFYGLNWQSIAGNGGLFLNKKGIKFSANDLSVAKKGYTDYGKSKDYEKIDLILKAIKKHSEH